MSIVLFMHMQVPHWPGVAVLTPVIVVGGVRRGRPRWKTRPRLSRLLTGWWKRD